MIKNTKKRLIMLITTLVILNLSVVTSYSQTDDKKINEDNYYKEFMTKTTKNLVKDYKVNNADLGDDSKLLQKAIDEVSKAGGGEIIVPKGVYYLKEVNLKSNIKLAISKDARIRPYVGNLENNKVKSKKTKKEKTKKMKVRNIAIFEAGKNSGIKNIKITTIEDNNKFSVELPKYPSKYGIKFIQLSNINNFYISNVNIYDSQTKFSAISLNPIVEGDKTDIGKLPENGVIKDISLFNGAYGYGTIQAQGANNIYFKNLYSQGGVTLRFETGYSKMNDMQLGGVNNIKAKNVSCEDGSAAVMFSPHTVLNKNIEVDGIKAKNCGFALRIENGFISNKNKNKNLKIGTFENVSVGNVEGTFGMRAQLKSKHFKYMSKDLQSYIYRNDTESENVIGPSVATVGDFANYKVEIKNIKSNGYKVKDILGEKDTTKVYTKVR